MLILFYKSISFQVTFLLAVVTIMKLEYRRKRITQQQSRFDNRYSPLENCKNEHDEVNF